MIHYKNKKFIITQKQKPLVSVIIPCYNVEEYIEQCLNSIIDNGYSNLEIICIDDRSTDSTVKRIKKFQKTHKNIQLYHNKLDYNIYGGACRNIGLKHATGKYVYFCDSDDYVLPGLFTTCVEKCERLNADICCFGHNRFDCIDGTMKYYSGFNPELLFDKNSNQYNKYSCSNVFQVSYSEAWDKFFSFDFIRKIGARFQEIKNSNDHLWHITVMSAAEKIILVDESFYVYRTNVKTSVQKERFDTGNIDCLIESIYACYEFVKKYDISLLKNLYEWIKTQLSWVLNRISFTNENLQKVKQLLHDIELDESNIISEYAKKSNNSIWNIFDKIICIHYLPYTERLEPIKKELKRVGILDLPQFEFYETVDNHFYQYVLDGIPKNRLCSIDNTNKYRVNKTNINYTIDSFSLLKKLQFFGYKRVLILEDDISFVVDINTIHKVIKSTPMDFDVINYDPYVVNGEFTRVNEFINEYKNSKIFNMSMCGLSINAINHIISKQIDKLNPFDIYMSLQTNGLKTYCSTECGRLAIQQIGAFDKRQSYDPIEMRYPNTDLNKFNAPITNCIKNKYDCFISFSTYGDRLFNEKLFDFLDSIVNQTVKNINVGIIMNLFVNDFNKIWSYTRLVEYIHSHNIIVQNSKFNYKPHLKYFMSMQKYSSVPIITVDDDWIYKKNMVQLLYDDWLEHKDMIIFGKGRQIQFDSSGNMKPFSEWNLVSSTQPSLTYSQVGYGAVLYPPNFNKLIVPEMHNTIVDNFLLADDLFLHKVAMDNLIESKLVKCSEKQQNGAYLVEQCIDSMSNSKDALWRSNISCNNNDVIINRLNRELR